MGHDIQYILETKRLVWLVASIFAVIIIFQYFEFPYGDVASSLFSAGRGQTPVNQSYAPEASFQTPQQLGNITPLDDSNYAGPAVLHEKGNTIIYNEHNISIENDYKSEKDGDLDKFTELDGHGVSGKHNSVSDKMEDEKSLAPMKAREASVDFSANNVNTSTLQNNISEAASPIPIVLLTPATVLDSNTSKSDTDASNSQKNPVVSSDRLSVKEVPPLKESHERQPMGDVVTISEMHDILAYNRASVRSMKPQWSSTVDQELLDAKLQIENAPVNENDRTLYPPLYLNVSRFKRSYELMEKTLKVYIYEEGEKPIFHQLQGVLTGIYASEGWFMKNMKENKHFVTKNAKQAHLFYIPFSSRMLEEKLFVPGSHSRDNLVQYLKNYINLVMGRYDFWNRTGGSDHFLVACHDWNFQMRFDVVTQTTENVSVTKAGLSYLLQATDETKKSMDSCIRALCNSDVKREGFKLGKDVSLPETYIRSSQNPLRDLGGKPPSQRSILAFFAGQMHGDVRPILLKHWENKDPDMKIFGKLRKSKNNRSYIQYMKSSRYCICPKGYEVNSPRVVEAIFYECVPVIISDNFVPPFFEILNWEAFAVFVQEKEISNLKNILASISNRRYLVMQQRVKKVQQHFVWHVKPVKYDIFHMILHSIWYNRVFRVDPIN